MPRPALLGHDLVGPEVPPEKVRRLVVELGETTLAEDVQPRSFPVEQPDLLSYVHNSLFLGSCTAFHRNLPPGGAYDALRRKTPMKNRENFSNFDRLRGIRALRL